MQPCAVGKFKHQTIAQTFDEATPMQRQDLFCPCHKLLPALHKIILVLLHEPHRLNDVHHHQYLGLTWKNQ
jgi:hypothetical protein